MIPLVRPQIPDWNYIGSLLDNSFNAGKLSNFGPCYWRLVEALADLTGRYDVPVTNGTVAIQLAAQAAFPRGSRVLCPDFTHIGTLQGLIAAGMRPILAPISKQTWTLNASKLVEKQEEFDAFIVVSPFGYRVDFVVYDQLSKELEKPVIYDLAGGFGMKVITTNPVCFSFHATKNVPVGEGGFISFSSPDQADKAFKLSCFDQNKDRSIASPYGGNYKMDEIRCAIALSQLECFSSIQTKYQKKRELLDFYQDQLSNFCIEHRLHYGNSAPSLCVLIGLPADELEARQESLGFEVKKYYPLLSEMSGLLEIPRVSKSSQIFRTCAALPSNVTESEAEMICKKLKTQIEGLRAKNLSH